ncbi:hypothetical protein [Providencia hangzhouensis]|uniref:hypothetical protein n=1 Tax=Providencia hangzhouensis TaxID=3031799 RepID=UPI0034DD9CA9
MALSEYKFERWSSRDKNSRPWSIYKKYNNELLKMYLTSKSSKNYLYKKLKEYQAEKTDSPDIHFEHNLNIDPENYKLKFKDIENWSKSYNQLDNWINLSTLTSLLSNLETYMATIVRLALESDIGIIYNCSKRIDGIELVKNNASLKKINEVQNNIVTSCVKGTWLDRANNFVNIFGSAPPILKKNISDLDKMRVLRNNFSHAFGRDIESSRITKNTQPIPITKLSDEKLIKYYLIIKKTARSIDKQLLANHIGEFSRLLYLHSNYSKIEKKENKHISLRKLFSSDGDSVGGEFCKGLLNYYDNF